MCHSAQGLHVTVETFPVRAAGKAGPVQSNCMPKLDGLTMHVYEIYKQVSLVWGPGGVTARGTGTRAPVQPVRLLNLWYD